MSEVVFWDTSAFVALGNHDDDLHRSAVAVNNELARQRVYILTTDAVLVEVANSFSKVAYRPLVQWIIEALQQSTPGLVSSHSCRRWCQSSAPGAKSVGGDSALAMHDLVDAHGGHADPEPDDTARAVAV